MHLKLCITNILDLRIKQKKRVLSQFLPFFLAAQYGRFSDDDFKHRDFLDGGRSLFLGESEQVNGISLFNFRSPFSEPQFAKQLFLRQMVHPTVSSKSAT